MRGYRGARSGGGNGEESFESTGEAGKGKGKGHGSQAEIYGSCMRTARTLGARPLRVKEKEKGKARAKKGKDGRQGRRKSFRIE